ncbi:hypothetical protein GCM10023219_20600 [Stakelama sediminis]
MSLAALTVLHMPLVQARCTAWQPLHPSATGFRPIRPDDLLGVTGIGRADAEPIGGASPLAVSPDHREAAFILSRADVKANRYCQALVLVHLRGAARPQILDRGGDFRVTRIAMRGIMIANGYPMQTEPAWSPEGNSIAYLRRDHGSTQLWLVDPKHVGARQLTHEPVDILDWAWMPDGKRIAFTEDAGLPAANRAMRREGRSGWVYDDRVTPNTGFRPHLAAPLRPDYRILDLGSDQVRPATASERVWLKTHFDTADIPSSTSLGPAQLRLTPVNGSLLAPRRIASERPDEGMARCSWQTCSGDMLGIWGGVHARFLLFLRREGWDNRFTALYRWTPGHGKPVRLMGGDALIERCTRVRTSLYCIRETATTPPQLVAIDGITGRLRVVFDPNAGFAHLRLGHVERLTWSNAFGLPVYGDLVLPPGKRARHRVPMIVTLYHSRGFLRGATGNEYPIYLFARHGYAVLSIERPPLYASRVAGLKTPDQVYAANIKNWSDRRSIQSAIARGVRLVIARGIADPARIGITGLSDGATAVRYALINSHLFAAAALSSCCVDESSDVLAGPAWSAFSQHSGFPPAYPVNRRFWQPLSFVLNASRLHTPLLMQLADREALYALPSFTALRQYHQPVAMRIFPDEYHIKWQPAHRAAIYRTNIDWFDFWLRNRIDPDPTQKKQYERWRALRRERPDSSTPSPHAP